MPRANLSLSTSVINGLLVSIFIVLLLAHVAGQTTKFYFPEYYVRTVVYKFDLEGEHNIPTYFSSMILLLAALLLGLIGAAKRCVQDVFATHWLMLGLVFLFLSLDEAAGLHEMLTGQMRRLTEPHGYLYFAWVVPGMALVVLLSVLYLRFLLHLPAYFRALFLIAGFIFLSGALGIESVEGNYFEANGGETFTYSMMVLIEESSEMIGIIIFINALMQYIVSSVGEITLGVQDHEIAGKRSATQRHAPLSRVERA